jgi:uncharacterized protein YkwD
MGVKKFSMAIVGKQTCWGLLCLSLLIVLAACGTNAGPQALSNSIAISHRDQQQIAATTPTLPFSIISQKATPTTARTLGSHASSGSSCVTYSNETTQVPVKNGTLAAPYGPAPATTEAQQLAQQLFQLINQDRVACGLSAFAWNDTLASGALLHSWNMYHCGFSHTCPDGSQPGQRIANEGFASLSDCGENIGEAGPSTPAWTSVAAIQNSMENEPPGDWHRIHLFSTTLHRIGIGVYVAPNGWVWFTEDMVS